MFATWGIHAVNTTTLNVDHSVHYPRPARNLLVTGLRLLNLLCGLTAYAAFFGVFPTLGCPVLTWWQDQSHGARVLVGAAITMVTWLFGDRNASRGLIIQRFYTEALTIGLSQVMRAMLEYGYSVTPIAVACNLCLDAVGTWKSLPHLLSFSREDSEVSWCIPFPEPKYPLPLLFLYLG